MIIRQENSADFIEVEALVKSAFETAEHSDKNEHRLVNRLRDSTGYIPQLSLVAEDNGKLIGHIMFTKAKVNDKTILALAPLSVLPSAQRNGVGRTLICKGHEVAKELGYDIVVVLGSEKYYPKLGYSPAIDFGILAPFDIPNENFMAINLGCNTIKLNGTIEYVKEIFPG